MYHSTNGVGTLTEPQFETDEQEQTTVLQWIRAQIQPVLDMVWRNRAADEAALETERQTHKDKRRKLVEGGYRESEGPGPRPGARGTYTPADDIKR